MIAFTYVVSGLLLAATGYLFARDLVSAGHAHHCLDGHLLLCLRRRERSLSHRQRDIPARDSSPRHCIFLCHGTGVGGISGPWLFGVLIETGSRSSVFAGYLLGAVLMVIAGGVAAVGASRPNAGRWSTCSRPLASADPVAG